MNPPDKNGGETIPPQDTPHEENRDRQVQPTSVSQSPPSPPQQSQSSRGTNDAPAWEKLAGITIAAGTIGLLIVNIVLLCSTQKAADAAKESADAQVALESPAIYTADLYLVSKDYFKEQPERMSQAGTILYPNRLHLRTKDGRPVDGPVDARVVVDFENDGLTPALVYGIELESGITAEGSAPPPSPDILHMRSEDPQTANTLHTRLFTGTIRPSQQQQVPYRIWDNHWWLSLSSEDVKAIYNKDKFLWIYGWLYVETSKDRYQKLHFCGRWVGTGVDIGDSFSSRWCPDFPYVKRESVPRERISDWYPEK